MAEQKSPAESEARPAATYSAPALEKGFNVIDLLAAAPGGLTIKEIASGLGLSMSEIFRIIMVMERRGWLQKSTGDRYRVTFKVLDLAFRATSAEELTLVAAPFMRQLAHRISQSCHLVVRNEDRGLVVMRQESPGPTGFMVRVGTEILLENTCSGHVLLAFGEIATDKPALSAALQKVRARGYEVRPSARTSGVTDISCPIFGFDGHIQAALTVPFLKLIDGTQTVDKEEARHLIVETANLISEGLGVSRR
jgi:DNA-binding IclR family transcriptional regulator